MCADGHKERGRGGEKTESQSQEGADSEPSSSQIGGATRTTWEGSTGGGRGCGEVARNRFVRLEACRYNCLLQPGKCARQDQGWDGRENRL